MSQRHVPRRLVVVEVRTADTRAFSHHHHRQLFNNKINNPVDNLINDILVHKKYHLNTVIPFCFFYKKNSIPNQLLTYVSVSVKILVDQVWNMELQYVILHLSLVKVCKTFYIQHWYLMSESKEYIITRSSDTTDTSYNVSKFVLCFTSYRSYIKASISKSDRQGHSRALAIVPYDRPHAISY